MNERISGKLSIIDAMRCRCQTRHPDTFDVHPVFFLFFPLLRNLFFPLLLLSTHVFYKHDVICLPRARTHPIRSLTCYNCGLASCQAFEISSCLPSPSGHVRARRARTRLPLLFRLPQHSSPSSSRSSPSLPFLPDPTHIAFPLLLLIFRFVPAPPVARISKFFVNWRCSRVLLTSWGLSCCVPRLCRRPNSSLHPSYFCCGVVQCSVPGTPLGSSPKQQSCWHAARTPPLPFVCFCFVFFLSSPSPTNHIFISCFSALRAVALANNAFSCSLSRVFSKSPDFVPLRFRNPTCYPSISCDSYFRNSPNQPLDDILSMSFLNLRNIAARPNNRLITDLPDPLLKVILQK